MFPLRPPSRALLAFIPFLLIPLGAHPATAGEGPTPASAEEGPPPPGETHHEEPSIFVSVEGAWLVPRNTDLDYAFITSSTRLSGGGKIVTLSAERRGIPRLAIAYRPPEEGAPAFGATFWEYHRGASSTTGEHRMGVGALLASPDFAIGRSLVDSAGGELEIRGTLVDAAVSWDHSIGERSGIGFSGGVRLFRFEERTTVTYEALRSGMKLSEIVSGSTDASGTGPMGSIAYRGRWGRVTLAGRIGLALPVGRLKAQGSDVALIDSRPDRSTEAVRPGTRKAFGQLDGELSVRVKIKGSFTATASYGYSQWSGVSLTQRFVDDVSQNTTLPVEGSAAWEGFALGLSCEF